MTRVLLFADENGNPLPELPFHRWPRSWGGWQAGSIIKCEGGDNCRFCRMRWTLVDPKTLTDVVPCRECGEPATRLGEDDQRYCAWCYDSTGQDPGAWK